MYGGDEVSAIVLDVGYTSCKAGFAGEDNPKAVFPTAVGVVRSGKDGVVGKGPAAPGEKMDVDPPAAGAPAAAAAAAGTTAGTEEVKYNIGTQALSIRKDFMDIENPIQDVKDWDLAQKLWDHAFKDRLRIVPEEHPMLLAEPSFNSNECREKLLEIMFEHYKVPAVFISKNAVLSSFSCGRSTAVVLDSGGGATCVAPVHEGYVLQKAIVRSPFSGEKLTEYLLSVLEGKGTNVRPPYMLNKKIGKDGTIASVTEITGLENIRPSFKRYMQKTIINDLKETVCRTSETVFDESSNAQIPFAQYELPDGKVIDVGAERFKADKCSIFGVNSPSELQALHDCINESVGKCDSDIKKDLYGTVIVTGGNTLFPMFKERLERELAESISLLKVKTISPMATTERRFSVWIGGSILASLGSFQQMWISKKQWSEEGVRIVHSQCP
ncbi:hypothetical protein GUITHDRAFT_102601 [Guillardia theta CCMP2712]|uniref:Uncharacterized protein n=1 Tax=Guillardia theta (strain CCMP2712) TaxID=905079 RepID=L1JU91_GUITC|nr:hypothetical protein GUITHDRAFT_102601 [Guillardia theta CCMP2712]EKX51987.1 hypothetical protein GUITHDRAFT_102601 [Guillardia theta CCMP2712]|eukprot:XP_005838967.1 hypothetical protein GUITHDRAFT_102601 [Guillardia theta CCMP2712]